MVSEYVPDCGHCIWIDLNPQSGHEQAGRRPALVLSPASYNRLSGLALICPITSRKKGYPFEAPLPENDPVSGVVLSDQVKSVDWRTRKGTFIGIASDSVLTEVREKIRVLIEL